MLELGTTAPDVSVRTHAGYDGPLSHFWEQGPLILFFYPKNNTHICTKEVCLLQAEYAAFAAFGANVMGSSTDSLASHAEFAEQQNLTFPLVADEKGHLARSFDAFRSLLRVSKRVTYVIGTDGKILGSVHNEFSLQPHLEMIRKVLENLDK